MGSPKDTETPVSQSPSPSSLSTILPVAVQIYLPQLRSLRWSWSGGRVSQNLLTTHDELDKTEGCELIPENPAFSARGKASPSRPLSPVLAPCEDNGIRWMYANQGAQTIGNAQKDISFNEECRLKSSRVRHRRSQSTWASKSSLFAPSVYSRPQLPHPSPSLGPQQRRDHLCRGCPTSQSPGAHTESIVPFSGPSANPFPLPPTSIPCLQHHSTFPPLPIFTSLCSVYSGHGISL